MNLDLKNRSFLAEQENLNPKDNNNNITSPNDKSLIKENRSENKSTAVKGSNAKPVTSQTK
jgi:hypothetical protein